MLRVTVEVVPFGEEEDKRTIATLDIGNIYTDKDIANYEVRADLEGEQLTFNINNHPRHYGWIPLVARILNRFTLNDTRV